MILGSSLGALLGLAEASALLWVGALKFGVPRAALSFLLTSATVYSVLGLVLAAVVLLIASALLSSPPHPGPRACLAAIPALLTFYSVCVLGHYFLEYPIRSPAFLLTLGAAALLSSSLWWALHTTWPRTVAGPSSHRLLRRALLATAPMTILILLAAQLVSLATTRMPPPPAQPGNVVLLTLDTLRPDRVGAYGYTAARTPNLDRLARSGVLFRQAYTPVVLTGPAHAAILTSGYPVDHLLKNNGQRIDAGIRTLPEIFRDAGYQTFAAVSVVHLDGHYSGLDKGFQSFSSSGRMSPFASLSFFRIANTALASLGLSGVWTPFRRGSRAVADFTSWLSVHHEEPFFAWIHIYDPHFPYGVEKAEISTADRLRSEIVNGADGPGDRRVLQLGLLYDLGVSSADVQVGRVLEALSKFGLRSNTLVVVASDHGETFANPSVDRRYWFHHMDIYEDTAHVAMMMSYPGKISPGLVIDSPVSLLDVAPTTLSLFGMDLRPQRFRGTDLLPILNRRAVSANRFCLMIQHAPGIPGLESWAVRQGCWKLVLRNPTTGPVELYNLCQDPAESLDLVARSPEIVSRLESCFRAQRRFFDVPAPPLSPLRALADDLRSLGYM
ncbi:MAG TPA: sulfatase [Thermoanaerobaculia bacterium]|nr:sulfatase [Thermoanaerobaculia bacterium]